MFHINRYNPFDNFNRHFDSFLDDDFDDLFNVFTTHDHFFVSQEDKLKRSLAQLNNYENRLHHDIKTYENSIDKLKKTQEQITKQKNELTQKINKLAEEKKALKDKPQQSSGNDKSDVSNRVYKKYHYKTPDMEIEEQYDSTNPKNCYKIIRKQGEAPQIVSGSNPSSLTHEHQHEQEQQQNKLEPLGEGLDCKFEQLCKLTGKKTAELRNLVLENKESTVGQLYDKAIELKLI